MSLTLREINLLKQRRKKSGPPCGVDFKRDLTSSVLTSRGFHCTTTITVTTSKTTTTTTTVIATTSTCSCQRLDYNFSYRLIVG